MRQSDVAASQCDTHTYTHIHTWPLYAGRFRLITHAPLVHGRSAGSRHAAAAAAAALVNTQHCWPPPPTDLKTLYHGSYAKSADSAPSGRRRKPVGHARGRGAPIPLMDGRPAGDGARRGGEGEGRRSRAGKGVSGGVSWRRDGGRGAGAGRGGGESTHRLCCEVDSLVVVVTSPRRVSVAAPVTSQPHERLTVWRCAPPPPAPPLPVACRCRRCGRCCRLRPIAPSCSSSQQRAERYLHSRCAAPPPERRSPAYCHGRLRHGAPGVQSVRADVAPPMAGVCNRAAAELPRRCNVIPRCHRRRSATAAAPAGKRATTAAAAGKRATLEHSRQQVRSLRRPRRSKAAFVAGGRRCRRRHRQKTRHAKKGKTTRRVRTQKKHADAGQRVAGLTQEKVESVGDTGRESCTDLPCLAGAGTGWSRTDFATK